jgi:UDP-N-acetylmuramate--alanine ligase
MIADHTRRRVPLLPPPATIHFVGIGGVGMSGLARIVAARGYHVTGSDAVDSLALASLRQEGFAVTAGHSPAALGSPALVVATAAAPMTNPELIAARDRAIPIVKRAALLGLLCEGYECIAVAGTHGKSTTSGMLAFALDRAGMSPSFAVGASVTQLGTNARAGRSELFVTEADEYDYSFLWLQSSVAVITNIEYDHPDIFPTRQSVEDAFSRFAEQIRPGGSLVISADDPACQRLAARLGSLPIRVITFGLNPEADWQVQSGSGDDVIRAPSQSVIPLRLRVPGLHNRLNAAAAIAASAAAGVPPPRLLPGLEEFSGVGRRFEVRGRARGVTVIDDYAHHPTEIHSTIAAARERYPNARVWVILQPHTYSRTKRLLTEFATALSLADRVVLTAIYPARETDDLGVSSEHIVELTNGVAEVVAGPEQAGRFVGAEADPDDIVLVLGAGDIWKASDAALETLGGREDCS